MTLNLLSPIVFANTFHDVAANTMLGTYGHRVISHNLFDKSYDIKDYNYHNDFMFSKHTEEDLAEINQRPMPSQNLTWMSKLRIL